VFRASKPTLLIFTRDQLSHSALPTDACHRAIAYSELLVKRLSSTLSFTDGYM
jgi:hypothetical protein